MEVDLALDLKSCVAQMEREIIHKMLKRYDNNYDEVALKLGISRTTLWRKSGDSHDVVA